MPIYVSSTWPIQNSVILTIKFLSGNFIIPILQMIKQSLREIKQLLKSHSLQVVKGQCRKLHKTSDSEACLLSTLSDATRLHNI